MYKSLLEGSSCFYSFAWSLKEATPFMAVASAGRAEVDTSRAFRSVKEAVAVFGERLLARETQLRPGARGDGHGFRERGSWPNAAAVVAAKLEGSDGGGRPSGLVRESLSKLDAIANSKLDVGRSKPAPNLISVPDAAPMWLVPSSPSSFVPSLPSPPRWDGKEANLMVMTTIKKVEEEAARTRQEMLQVKRRMAETELAMANLNAKLHRALSKMAHMEAARAAAARASIQKQRDGSMAAPTMHWTEPRPRRQPLGHLLSLGDSDYAEEEIHGNSYRPSPPRRTMTTATSRRKIKVEKEKPMVPLVVPFISGMIFSMKKKRMKDESLYMKELYSLLRLT